MEATIMVAFATRNGSTEELARFMAEILRDVHLYEEVWPAPMVSDLATYTSVVLVAPLYMGRLHRDARRFLWRNRHTLEQTPVALLVPGPVRNDEKDWAGARAQLSKELARFGWLKPIAAEVVGGVWDPQRLGFPFKLIPALRKMEASDARDWDAIGAVGRGIAAKLQARVTVGA